MEQSKNRRFEFKCDIVHAYNDYSIWVYAESYEEAEKKLKEKNLVDEVVFTEPTKTEFNFKCDDKNGYETIL